MQADDPKNRIVLDLPKACSHRARGPRLRAGGEPRLRHEFARADTRKAFFLVLADAGYRELEARKVSCEIRRGAGAGGRAGGRRRQAFRAHRHPGSSWVLRPHPALSAGQQDKLLRSPPSVREELDQVTATRPSSADRDSTCRAFRSAIAYRRRVARQAGPWSARQLYYACDEQRPRIFDQGLAGFAMGTDDPRGLRVDLRCRPMPPPRSNARRSTRRARCTAAADYSANAYPFSLRYQNGNQWVMEMLARAWGDLADGDELRARAQDWLRVGTTCRSRSRRARAC